MTNNIALRQLRLAHGWTQQDLANLLTVHRSTVVRWEQGIIPERYHQEKLCELFGVSVQQLGLTTEWDQGNEDSLWYLPHPRNPFFTGREEILSQLHTALQGKQSVTLTQSLSLSGLGGIGKTQTAIEYVYRYADEYTAVLWISAETYETCLSSIMTLAEVLTLPQMQEQEKVVEAFLRWLATHQHWLLIFDNVEDLVMVKRFLPPTRSGSLLFTSRRQNLGFAAHTLDLQQMPLEEGMRFLLYRARLFVPTASPDTLAPEEISLAKAIVAAMDGLPLALDQAAAYIEAAQCSLRDYLSLLRSAPLRLLTEREASADHPQSIVATFALAFERLMIQNQTAAEILTICAYLAPESIPDMFFLEGATHLGSTLEALAVDPFAFQDAMKALLAYSLIRRDGKTQTVVIHRLVQAVIKGHLTQEKQRTWEMRVLRAMVHLFPSNELLTGYEECGQRLLPHALRCLSNFSLPIGNFSLPIGNEKLVCTLLVHVANYLFDHGQWEETETFIQQALLILETLPDSQVLLAKAVGLQGGIYRMKGNFKQAHSFLMRSLSLREQASVPDLLLVSKGFNSLANLYLDQRMLEEAEAYYLRTLSLREAVLSSDDPQLANINQNLAIVYIEMKRYGEAVSFASRALSINEASSRFKGHRVPHAIVILATAYMYHGEYVQAEAQYLRALALWEQIPEPKHPEFAEVLTGLAILYRDQGKYEEALPFFQQGLLIVKQYRSSQTILAITLEELGLCYHRLYQIKEARQCYHQALTIYEEIFGTDHSKTQEIRTIYELILEESERGKNE